MDIAELGFAVESDGVVKATDRLDKLDKQSKKNTKTAERLQKRLAALNKMIAKMAKIAAIAGLAIAALSIRAFAKFDAAMTKSLAIMGNVSDAMRKRMSDAARKLALTVTFSAEQVAESYFFLASAGLNAEQSIAALPQVAKFAQAGMFDMATATDLATDAQSALGKTVSDSEQNLKNLTKVTDVLIGANTIANATAQQFSESLTNKAGTAMRDLNIEIETGVAVLAAWADQGVKGTEAGERFNIVTRDLQTAIRKNADEFEKYKIAVFEDGAFRNMADIISDIEGALDGMSTEQKGATLSLLGFQDRSVIAIRSLVGMSGRIRDYEERLRSMGGITQEVADKQLKTFSAQMDLLGSVVNDAGISIGELLAPALIELISGLRGTETEMSPLVTIGETLAKVFGRIAQGALLAGFWITELGLRLGQLLAIGDTFASRFIGSLDLSDAVKPMNAITKLMAAVLSMKGDDAVASINAAFDEDSQANADAMLGLVKTLGAALADMGSAGKDAADDMDWLQEIDLSKLPQKIKEAGGAAADAATHNKDFALTLDQLEATLNGPVADAQQLFNELESEAIELKEKGEITQEQLTRAIKLYKRELKLVIDENDEFLGSLQDAISEADDFESSIGSLMASLFPLEASTRQAKFAADELERAWFLGIITLQQYDDAVAQLEIRMKRAQGLFGNGNNSIGQLLATAFDEAKKDRSFKSFFKAIVDGFKHAAEIGAEALSDAIAQTAGIAAGIVDAIRNNPDAPLRGLAEGLAGSGIPVVSQIAQAVQAIDSIFGGRLLGTNFESVASGFNVGLGAGGVSGTEFDRQERQRSFFRGTSSRTVESALDNQLIRQLEDFLDNVAAAMGQAARRLSVSVPDMIAGEFEQEFDKDGNLVRSTSRVLGRVFEESFEEFQNRVLAENILAVLAQSAGDVEVTRDRTVGDLLGPNREGRDINTGRVIGEITVLMNEVDAIADRWRDDADKLLEGAQFLLLAQTAIAEGFGLLGAEGGLTATVDLVEELAFAGETLSETFIRLVSSTTLFESILGLAGVAIDGTREALVRLSADVIEAAGGLQAAGSLWKKFSEFFFTTQQRLEQTLSVSTARRDDLLADLGLARDISKDAFIAAFEEALTSGDAERIATFIQAGAAMSDVAAAELSLAEIREGEAAEALEALLEREREAADFMEDLNEQLAELVFSSERLDFRRINDEFAEMTERAIDLGLSEETLGRIRDLQTLRLRQLAAELESSLASLTDELFGTSESFTSVASQARQATQSLDGLADSIHQTIIRIQGTQGLSNLNPTGQRDFLQAQFDAAMASGDFASANQLAGTLAASIRSTGSSGQEADAMIQALLDDLAAAEATARAFTPPTGAQVGAIGQSVERVELSLLRQIEISDQILDQIGLLSEITGESAIDIADRLGIPLAQIVSNMIDVSDFSSEQVSQLGIIAMSLGLTIGELGDVLGLQIGLLTESGSLLNEGLRAAIMDLPGEISKPLMFALGEAERTGDVEGLENLVDDLPAGIRDRLAPFFDNISLTDFGFEQLEVQNEIAMWAQASSLAIDETNRILNRAFFFTKPETSSSQKSALSQTSTSSQSTTENNTSGTGDQSLLKEIRTMKQDITRILASQERELKKRNELLSREQRKARGSV